MTEQSYLPGRLQRLTERYREAVAAGNYFYESEIQGSEPTRVVVDGRSLVMLSSYSYLGLLHHPDVDAAAESAVHEYGTGSHGVRLLAGTTPLHRELEAQIADFKRSEAAIALSSGYVANLAAITTAANRHTVVICDKLDHASIVDACRLSQAEVMRFNHNDLDDLTRCLRQTEGRNQLVIVDGIYSMDGDVADLPGILDRCGQFGAALMVDEAHSLGVLGRTGSGIDEHFGLSPDAIDIKMGTLSKAIPSVGGYVAGSRELIDAIRHNASGYIFSGALPPPQAAAALAALQVIAAEPERVRRLQENAVLFHRLLRRAGFDLLRSTTPIVPLICRTEAQAYSMTRFCRANGVFVTPIVFPAVARSLPRLRLVVTALHTADDIQSAVEVLAAAGRSCGLLEVHHDAA